MEKRIYHVSCYDTPGNTHKAQGDYVAATYCDAARAFSREHLGGALICGGRMETGGVRNLWSFSAIGYGQRVWVREVVEEM